MDDFSSVTRFDYAAMFATAMGAGRAGAPERVLLGLIAHYPGVRARVPDAPWAELV